MSPPFVLAVSGVRIVRPYQRGIVEQLGKYKETKDPDDPIIPFAQSLHAFDMREQVVDVPPQEVITSRGRLRRRRQSPSPTPPQWLASHNVANFFLAITKLARRTSAT